MSPMGLIQNLNKPLYGTQAPNSDVLLSIDVHILGVIRKCPFEAIYVVHPGHVIRP